MLYVFHVDTGTMMTFDMNLALESVRSLQSVIAKGCRIPEDKQVLLVSGGESLDPTATVGKYHAGTDTNPIFLFSKSTIEAATPPSPSVNYGSDVDLQGQVEGSLLMPPVNQTVVSRAQLALTFRDVDTEELAACERLIHDQHLQQQGWAAVVANLEDVTSELQSRSNTFQESYVQYLAKRQSYLDTLSTVSETLLLLSKIPVLSCLSRPSDETISLFDWISSQDTNHSLQDMVEQCMKATEQMDHNVGDALHQEVEQMFADVHNPSMKEVKGLEDRLYGLDQLMSGARKIVQEQSDLAQGFVHNQNRVSDLKDTSILPDLCSSHKNQLVEMLKNHKRIREIKKKCRMAKEELSINLHTRLRWVMYVEKKICDVDGKLTIYHGNLRRLSKRLDILQQVHDAPRVYAQLVTEVVRRRQFSDKYLNWATTLAEDSSQLHAAEIKRRESFVLDVGRHFLQSLFQGFEDYPSIFATEAPAKFDNHLPPITSDDISMLKTSVPELSGVLSVPPYIDLFAGIKLVTKDSSVQWVERSDQDGTLHIQRTTSGTGSDIDIINSDHPQMSLEGGSMSLGENLAECQQDTEILVKPTLGEVSPDDKKEFLLPKSLSEALTKEMKEEKRRSGEFTSKLENISEPLEKSGDTDKTSTESEPQSPDTTTMINGRKGKSLSARQETRGPSKVVIGSDTSPETENSMEFTTADFYIDESMPSSIGDSPPNKASTEDKRSPEQRLQTEKQQNERLQKDLKDCELKVTVLQCKLKTMKETFEEKLTAIKGLVKSFSQNHEKNAEEFKSEFESLKGNVLSVLIKFDSNLNSGFKDSVHKMVLEQTESERDLNEKLQQEMHRCKDLANNIEKLEMNIKSLTDTQAQQLSQVSEEKSKMETQYKEELDELKKQYELEQEIELDRIRSTFEEQVQTLEKAVEDREADVKVLEEKIEKTRKDRIKLEESLLERHQKEKDEILGIIEKEFQCKMERALQEERGRLEAEKQAAIEILASEYEQKAERKLEELTSKFTSEKEQELLMTQSTLTLEHTQQTKEIRQSLLQEKEAELKEMEDKMQMKIQEDLACFGSQFNEEKKKLMSDLQKFTDKIFEDCSSQTESLLEQTDTVSQTDAGPSMCETSFQTDRQSINSASMQTDRQDQQQLSTQTDILEHSNTSVQTSLQCQANQSMQTENVYVSLSSTIHQDVQTDVETREVSQPGVQTSATEQESMSDTVDSRTDSVESIKRDHEAKTQELMDTHDMEISELISRLEKEKEDSSQLKTSLTSMVGDKQVKFNEAVSKVSQEKDRVIEELRKREKELLDQQAKDKATLEQALAEKGKVENVKDRVRLLLQERERELTSLQRQYKNDMSQSQQQLVSYQQQLQGATQQGATQQGATEQAATEEEPTPSPSVIRISDPEEGDLKQKIRELEDVVRIKDEEIMKMQQKVMDLSMSASTRSLVQEKVSITSCHVGDLVLLCLDERLDQYVVFTVGNTLHFLHTDCLLGLGIHANPGVSRKQWLIAEVTDKEYCQAKKANNRFKVPVGTKFYRVRAKPWSRDPGVVRRLEGATGTS